MPTEPIGRIDHIAIAVFNIEKARTFFEGVLGATFRRAAISAGGDFQYVVFDLFDFTLELLEPISPDGFVAKFLEKHGQGVHHITLQVPDLQEKVRIMEGIGVRIVDKHLEGSQRKEAFISPRSACGVLFQLAESRPPLNNRPYWEREEP